MPRKLHQMPPYTSLPVSSQAGSHETAFPSSSRATMSASEPYDNGNDHAHDNRHDHSDWSDLFSQGSRGDFNCSAARVTATEKRTGGQKQARLAKQEETL